MTDEPQERLSLVDEARREGNLIETHISWVILGGQFVFKLKKPVDLGFLDFSTREQRHAACQAELELNSRFAPRVYLGLVPVRQSTKNESRSYIDDADFPGTEGSSRSSADPIVDWAVKMRRLDDGDRADILLSQQRLGVELIEQLADWIHSFHQRCATDERIAAWGQETAVRQNVLQNFEQTEEILGHYLAPRLAADVRAHQLGFLDDNAALFEARVRSGRIRDGHGDLRLEHVYFTADGLQIIDCIEFNEAFRFGDVCADLAFLVMDLRHQERPDLAERLLARYAEKSGDFQIYRLIDFYEAYRAFVRGKVLALLELEKSRSGQQLPSLHERARRFFLHAAAMQQPSIVPGSLIAVGGFIASGKSTVSQRIAKLVACPVVDADSCRKRLAGLSPRDKQHHAPYTGLYSQAMSEKVYSHVLEIAEWVLDSGRSVVIDATFRSPKTRKLLSDFAQRRGADVHFVWCEVSRETALRRLKERAREGGVSDGRTEIYDDVARGAVPPADDEFPQLLRLDTARPLPEQGRLLSRFLEER